MFAPDVRVWGWGTVKQDLAVMFETDAWKSGGDHRLAVDQE